MNHARINLRQQLAKLSLPLFFDIALVMLIGAADALMLARWSDGAAGAVGMVNQLVTLVFLVYQFISMGAAILSAQYFGAGEWARLRVVARLALALNAVFGLAVSAMLALKAEAILRLMGLDAALLPDAVRYLQITGSLSFFPALSLTLGATLRSCDRTVEPMLANLAANLVNLVGNTALIFGHFGCPALGAEGAAWATAVARIAAFGVLAATYCAGKSPLRAGRVAGQRAAPLKELANLFKVGIPAMSEEISYCLSQVAVIYFINRISIVALTTKTYCTNIINFMLVFVCSMTQGGSILVGHLVGRRQYRAAYLVGTYVLRRGMTVTLACAVLLAAAAPFILGFLTDNADIVRLGSTILVIEILLEVGRVRNIFACGTLRAAGDVVYPVVVGVTVQWSVGVGVAWALGLPLGYGLVGIWIGFTLDENIRGVILMRRWHSLRWQGKSFA